MNENIKEVLNKIIENHGEAYVVGGYVRDLILNKESYDVDISTSLLPNQLLEIFPHATSNAYGGIAFTIDKYDFEITTYRKEKKYDNRRPVEFEYVNSIEEDIIRRDFTINSIYMDIEGNIIDPFNGKDDVENKLIRAIGNINDKMVEDPLRILRAIRFKVLLDFEIEDSLLNYIKQNKELINALSYNRIKEELDIIIKSDNRVKGLMLLKELGFEDVLEIKIPDEIDDSVSPLCIWAQLDFSEEYPFSKQDLKYINDIKSIVSYGIIDNVVLYQYGLYVSQLAGDILNISDSYISDIYKDLPIYSSKDIDIDGDEIIDLLKIEPSNIIKKIMNDIELNILSGNLANNKEDIKKYIEDNWR